GGAGELHTRAADGGRAGAVAGDRVRPVHRLRGVPGIPHGRGARTRGQYEGSDPDGHRPHRTDHHRGRADPDRGRRAFGFSEIVMMKYIAFGLIAALILDATVIRMLLVPSVMALLGD